MFDIFTGKSAKDAAAANTGLYQQYQNQATGALNTGLQQSTQAYAPLTALGQKYGQGTNAYMDALGINGPEGNTRAVGAFQAGPGYQWQVDQATDAAARNAAKLGLAGSGNTLNEISTRAGNLANQEYGNYLTRLGGFVPQEAATVGAGASGLAGIYGADATNRANVFGQAASGQAGSNTAAANAEMAGSGNFWNGLFSLGGNVARAYGDYSRNTQAPRA